MNSPCIFCKIIKRELPASIFYEDNEVLGFMNHRPVHHPECLFVPKEHIDHFMDIDEALASKMMKLSQRLSRFIYKNFQPERIGYVVAGYTVAHAHFIIIPQYHENDITSEHFAVLKDQDVVFTDEHIPITPREELDSMAEKLKMFNHGKN